MSKAGELFVCSCCKEEHEIDQHSYDEQCGGPVCDTCRRYFIKALAYLKHEGINRGVTTDDVTEENINRLKHLM
jgi:queuine/archaeosine tRNA-ribosyltransferase